MEASPNLYKWVLQLAAPIALQNIIAMSGIGRQPHVDFG